MWGLDLWICVQLSSSVCHHTHSTAATTHCTRLRLCFYEFATPLLESVVGIIVTRNTL